MSTSSRTFLPPEMVQWPFIGVVALLVLLLLLTPALLAPGTPVAGPATQAILIVDQPSGANSTRFYVEGIIQTLRYSSISIGFAHGLSWPPVSAKGLVFAQWTNVTNMAASFAADARLPDAINVTAVYVDSAGTAVTYVGVYAFGMVGASLDIVALTPQLVGDSPSSLGPGALPQQLPLYLVPTGASS